MTLIWWLLAGAVVSIAGYSAKYWWDGRRGLDQWPNPHGRYYDQWMRLPEGAGDYYEWLAKQMGNREPWQTWARMEREQGDDEPD